MTRWKKLGKYLGRPVRIAEFSTDKHAELGDLDAAVVLLVLRNVVPMGTTQAFLKSLIDRQPLAVMVSGADARAVFDVLIAELSDGAPRRHVMTKLCEADDVDTVIEELLKATWPSDDRFDEWKEYAVIVVNGDAAGIEQAIKRVCA